MLNVICVKTGDKYGAEYVNKLYRAVKRNLAMPFDFWCFTDDERGLDGDFYGIRFTPRYPGWWNKMEIFGKVPFDGHVLFLDLDVAITGNLEDLIVYGDMELEAGAPLVILEDFNAPGKYGSAVMMFEAGSLEDLYLSFEKNADAVIANMHGDQEYIHEFLSGAAFWPREAILSYKVDKLDRPELPEDAAIVCFHGKPKNNEVNDEWLKRSWI